MNDALITLQNKGVNAKKLYGLNQNLELVTGSPSFVNFFKYEILGTPFRPQCLLVDNTFGYEILTVSSFLTGITLGNVNIGQIGSISFPCIDRDTFIISGYGGCSLFWSEIPLRSSESIVTLSGIVEANIYGQRNKITVVGTPYLNTVQGALSSTVQNLVITPVIEYMLYRLVFSISGDCTQTTSGDNLLTVVANSNTIYQQHLYIPATNSGGQNLNFTILNDEQGLYMGSGTINASLANPLISGFIDFNAFLG